MGITKPYYRIIRPLHPQDPDICAAAYDWYWERDFPADPRYANDRQELWRAYMLIEKDLLRLFEYVEPTDDNIEIYSHRTYELLLRAATEFETNCKRILESNGYSRRKNLNTKDYFKIHKSSKLGDYAIFMTVWFPKKKLLKPFQAWADGNSSLSWYQSYNLVKHDRNREFPKASLENVLMAVAALYIILFSQFVFVIDRHLSVHVDLVNYEECTISQPGHIFEVMPPRWSEDEIYDFDWEEIKGDSWPFARFPFG